MAVQFANLNFGTYFMMGNIHPRKGDVLAHPSQGIFDPLADILGDESRKLLAQVVEAELVGLLAQYADEQMTDRRTRVYPSWSFSCAIGFGHAFGPNAPALSSSTISCFKDDWRHEYADWLKRDFSTKHSLYMWLLGVHFQTENG